ncbi:hypothetical protein [Streptosporangium sandarakinum]|uniref:hypothetical protein n=1 Tax=Streptosporangium sandarakinum TaxID=1260955 RepID=UPI00341273FA
MVETVRRTGLDAASSRKKNRSSSARDGAPANAPYRAACSSDRNSTGMTHNLHTADQHDR